MLSGHHVALATAAIAVAMIASGIAGVRCRAAALALGALAIAWFALDNAWEGPVLLTVAPGHGLTLSDLPGVVALVTAGWLFVRRR